MSQVVYRKLQEQLDQYSVGYPTTESGIEIKILERLFKEKEAEIFLQMSLSPESSIAIAARAGSTPSQIDTLLDEMYRKGLVFRHAKDGDVKYGAVPFIEGIWEYQVKSMDRELAQLFEDYVQENLHENVTNTSPLLIHRPIAINQTIDISFPVLTYESSRKIVQNQKLIVVTDCICRVQKGLIEKGCDKPLETCFMFGTPAKYFIDRSIGRQVSIDEAFHILDVCEKAGLVTMPLNTQKPANLCNCCSDCCIVLNNLKRFSSPANMVKAKYRAVVDPEKCENCDACVERCPMDALFRDVTDSISTNQDKCIGCGLCVNGCPVAAIHLEVRPKAEPYEPPKTGLDFYKEVAQMRGKNLTPLALVSVTR
ncbi:ATP-binding protein [Desulfosarcina ovata]|uniref:ATP-binding protein n=1 Tax=Desulfosarcina ovata TaxID=83564 RepID=UPI0012D3438A|nr:4Fe-4S binding protein [Desulfosarcina ovata]